ncbi:MAG: phospholipase [Kastovskya adunca ATA6-11-RM4]|nr:phospholipase [Kastovskya adunca ATA6-11-RM4]
MLRQKTDIGSRLRRRHLLGMFLAGITGAIGSACTTNSIQRITSMRTDKPQNQDQASMNGRLLARPTQPTGTAPIGLQPLGLSTKRDGLLYVPKNYQASRPAPLVVMLHGAGGDARGGLMLQNLADAAGLILLAPASRRQTWDVLFGEYGPDITLIDQALAQTFSRYAVDPTRLAIAGFSDGASYALSVGITNGDLFTHVIAFSPGFMAPASQVGSPRLFISHGTQDSVLPIDNCSRRIVPQVQRAGYDVVYREFDGSHTIPPAIALSALEWFTA